jgi:hypothetical protein
MITPISGTRNLFIETNETTLSAWAVSSSTLRSALQKLADRFAGLGTFSDDAHRHINPLNVQMQIIITSTKRDLDSGIRTYMRAAEKKGEPITLAEAKLQAEASPHYQGIAADIRVSNFPDTIDPGELAVALEANRWAVFGADMYAQYENGSGGRQGTAPHIHMQLRGAAPAQPADEADKYGHMVKGITVTGKGGSEASADDEIVAKPGTDWDYIAAQAPASEGLGKPGETRIGDIYLTVPPQHIHVGSSVANYAFDGLRLRGTPKVLTGQQTWAIEVQAEFPRTDLINDELRKILAQFKRTPFTTVKNELISKSLSPIIGTPKDVLIDDEDLNLGTRKLVVAKEYSSVPVFLKTLSISTVPGHPNSLNTSMDIVLFNHLPYNDVYGFVGTSREVEEACTNNQLKRNGLLEYSGRDKDDPKVSEPEPTLSDVYRRWYYGLLSEYDGLANKDLFGMSRGRIAEALTPESPESQFDKYDATNNNELTFTYEYSPDTLQERMSSISTAMEELRRARAQFIRNEQMTIQPVTQARANEEDIPIEGFIFSQGCPLFRSPQVSTRPWTFVAPGSSLKVLERQGKWMRVQMDEFIDRNVDVHTAADVANYRNEGVTIGWVHTVQFQTAQTNIQDISGAGSFAEASLIAAQVGEAFSFVGRAYNFIRRQVFLEDPIHELNLALEQIVGDRESLSVENYLGPVKDPRTGKSRSIPEYIGDLFEEPGGPERIFNAIDLIHSSYRKILEHKYDNRKISETFTIGGPSGTAGTLNAERMPGNTVISGITCTYTNPVAEIPVMQYNVPTLQHVRVGEFVCSMNLQTDSLLLIRELRNLQSLLNHTAIVNKLTDKRLRNYIDTRLKLINTNAGNLFKSLGIHYLLIQDISIDNVDNQPGWYNVRLSLQQADILPWEYEILEGTKRVNKATIDAAVRICTPFVMAYEQLIRRGYLGTAEAVYDSGTNTPGDVRVGSVTVKHGPGTKDDLINQVGQRPPWQIILDHLKELRANVVSKLGNSGLALLDTLDEQIKVIEAQVQSEEGPPIMNSASWTAGTHAQPEGPWLNLFAEAARKIVEEEAPDPPTNQFTYMTRAWFGGAQSLLADLDAVDEYTGLPVTKFAPGILLLNFIAEITQDFVGPLQRARSLLRLQYFRGRIYSLLENEITRRQLHSGEIDTLMTEQDRKLQGLDIEGNLRSDSRFSTYPDLELPAFTRSALDTSPSFYMQNFKSINQDLRQGIERSFDRMTDYTWHAMAVNNVKSLDVIEQLKKVMPSIELTSQDGRTLPINVLQSRLQAFKDEVDGYYQEGDVPEHSPLLARKLLTASKDYQIVRILYQQEVIRDMLRSLGLLTVKQFDDQIAALNQSNTERLNDLDQATVNFLKGLLSGKSVINPATGEIDTQMRITLGETGPGAFSQMTGYVQGLLARASAAASAVGITVTTSNTSQVTLRDLQFSVSSLLDELEAMDNFTENPDPMIDYWGIHTHDKTARQAEILRKALDHIRLDKTGDMSRMYPTFKLYFIEEDSPEWLLFDDYYSYSAVKEISVIKSKRAASDVAVIRLSNITGILSDPGAVNAREPVTLKQGTDEQFVRSLYVRAGMSVMIRMGYGAHPNDLPIVFQGAIAEVKPGEDIELVCSGWGMELLNPVGVGEGIDINWDSFDKAHGDVASRILNSLDGLDHFGRWSWFNDTDGIRITGQQRWGQLFMEMMGLDTIGTAIGKSNRLDENIYLAYSNSLNPFKNITFDWRIYNQTAWDALQEICLYHPNYIVRPLPFNDLSSPVANDVRMTLYIGPKDGYYRFSDDPTLLNAQGQDYAAYEKYWFETELGNDEALRFAVSELRAIAAEVVGANPISDSHIMLTTFLNSLKERGFSNVATYLNVSFIPDRLSRKMQRSQSFSGSIDARRYIETIVEILNALAISSRIASEQEGVEVPNITYQFKPRGGTTGNKDADEIIVEEQKKGTSGKAALAMVSDIPALVKREGTSEVRHDLVDHELVKNKRSDVANHFFANHPHYRPVQSTWLVDSYHHIIRNDITANAEEMSNEVVLTFPDSEPVMVDPRATNAIFGSDTRSYRALLDDDIKPEHRRIYNTFQKNIDTNAWDETVAFFTFKSAAKEREINRRTRSIASAQQDPKLGTGHRLIVPSYIRVANTILANQMQNMYSGELQIIGNPNIKPYDTIYLHDDYNDMSGPIEVDTVVHTLNAQTGLTTTITPALITYQHNYRSILDYDYLQSQYVKGLALGILSGGTQGYFGLDLANMAKGWIDKGVVKYGQVLEHAPLGTLIDKAPRLALAPLRIGSLVGGLLPGLNIVYSGYLALDTMYRTWTAGMGRIAGNNVVNFTGLQLRGVPYISGIDGYRLNNIWVSKFQRFAARNQEFIVQMGQVYGSEPGIL